MNALRSYFLLILLASTYCGHAQDYVITTKGDTVRGEVKLFNMGTDKKAVVLNASKKKVAYPMFQTKRIFQDGKVYDPVKMETGYAFMRLEKEGYLSLYAFQLPNETRYDGQLLFKKDGSSLQVPNLNFKKLMKKFLEECKPVTDSIESKWGKKDLTKIVDTYNNWINANTSALRESIEKRSDQKAMTNVWDELESKVKTLPDFDKKSDALEMISEIKGKITRGERVPKFLIEGLKSSLESTDVKAELEAALQHLEAN